MSVDRIIGRVAADYREQVRGGFEVNKSALVMETPKKKLHTAPVSNYELQKNLLADGWNNCIDAITGEVK